MNEGLKIGFCQLDINPKGRVSIAGYFDDRFSEGILDNLYSKAVVFDDGRSRMLFISIDICWIPNAFVEKIRNGICAKIKIPKRNIFITTTHTHTAPTILPAFRTNPTKSYVPYFIRRVIESGIGAFKKLYPVNVEIGTGKCEKLAFNRRYLLKDGRFMTNPPADAGVVKPVGPVDDSMAVIKLTDMDKKIKVIIVHCTNHCDTISGNLISADWPGVLYSEIQKKYGRATGVVFFNGSAGDVNHFDIINKRMVCNRNEMVRIGKGYARTALKILSGKMQKVKIGEVSNAVEILKIPLRRVPATEIKRAKELIKIHGKGSKARTKPLEACDLAKGSIEVEIMFAEDMLELLKEKKKAFDAEIHVLKIGEIAIVGIPGEVFTEIGLAIKKASPFKRTFIAELSNGSFGYIPTEKAFKQGGGYEIKTARSSKLVANADSMVVGCAISLLQTPAGRRRESQRPCSSTRRRRVPPYPSRACP